MASPLQTIIPLTLEERLKTGGCTHLQPIDFNDFLDTAGTTKTLSILSGKARQGLGRIFFALKTAAVGASITNLTVKATLNYASSTDKETIPAFELCAAATELLAGPPQIADADASTVDGTYGAEEQAVIGSLRTKLNQALGRLPIVPGETWTLDLLFTATGANLDALTALKLQVFVERIDLDDFDQVTG
jgi:hypothetical protein